MNKKIKFIQLKILLVILEIMLVLLIWTLVQVVFLKRDEVAERFQATPTQPTEQPIPTATPFTLSNFDKIRVVITNKETGGIYHEDATQWQERTDYRGTLEVFEETEGFVVINELPIEEYLYSVVPSEMPASYPMEALKAQAICARTYAYLHVLAPGYPQWNAHVDDTTAYQVYHSVEEQESTTRAVNETQGMVLCAPGGNALAQTYYYSTSCGYGSDAHVWRSKYSDSYPYIKSKHISRVIEPVFNNDIEVGIRAALTEDEFDSYIRSVNQEDYESQEGWYRWTYRVEDLDTERVLDMLQKRYAISPKLILTQKGNDFVSQPIEKIGNIYDIQICRREAGGVADELLIYTDVAVYKVITELNIRYILNDGRSLVKRQDGESVEMNSLLPSAFISLSVIREDDYVIGYEIYGGGFGHGAGMSQNAAKAMANEGMCAGEILTFFFEECIVKDK
ncbi:MAG: SpoIID/LytB domain-containing protein [Lachnospiraceae bacterium]|nr:SpoIID/LytB domain-containing protein [Lachnospiraceae bacterium]